MPHRPTRLLGAALAASAAVVLAACGSSPADDEATGPPPGDRGASGFARTAAAARGQTVRWWMYGGDPKINAYVDDHVVPAAAKAGVTLRRVPVTDTAEALNRIVAERRAGKESGGGVDLLWLNGENFATGKTAGLWLEDWADDLPAAAAVDRDDPVIAQDFRVPVDGQESPWSRAGFVFAHDRDAVRTPPTSFPELLAYAKAHPGRVAYPAPPDFTGSAFVRQVIQRLGSREKGLAYLRELRPVSYRGGRVQPKSQQELDGLFADGQVDFAMSYDASFVATGVQQGRFPRTARPFLIGGGALQNTSYVTIPRNAAHPEGAKVVADLLLSPRLQAIKADPDVLGIPTVLDDARLTPADRRLFRDARSPYLLRSFGTPLLELPAADVAPIERAWADEVQR